MSDQTITLIGAGLAGSLLAIFLARRGWHVDLYERRPDMRQVEMSAGRSINLAMSTRGIYALQQVGLYDAVQALAIPMRGRVIHPLDGPLAFQPYGQDDTQVLHAISRADLNKALMNAAAAYPGVRFFFAEQCRDFQVRSGELTLYNTVRHTERVIQAPHVIGTDGSASAIRTSLLSVGRFNFSQDYIEHGYKELTIPPGPHGTFQIDKHALHIWPRGTYMLIALPNLNGSFTCTLFLPFTGDYSFDSLSSPESVVAFFQQQFPDVVPLLPRLVEEFFAHPTGALVTIKCFPWYVGDKVLLLGDAAHAIVPFYGQGMNCAFEDCTILDACVEQYAPDWQRVFHTFAHQRKEHTDAIADMAVSHFIEMRDRVADAKFLLQKSLELELERRYPGVFVPQYAMVTFHRVPYAVARRRGERQEQILHELCAPIDRLDDVDWHKAERLITQHLRTTEREENLCQHLN
jgi:kynurenine 3-monooxygenase